MHTQTERRMDGHTYALCVCVCVCVYCVHAIECVCVSVHVYFYVHVCICPSRHTHMDAQTDRQTHRVRYITSPLRSISQRSSNLVFLQEEDSVAIT